MPHYRERRASLFLSILAAVLWCVPLISSAPSVASAAPAAPTAVAPPAAMNVTPTTGLDDGQTISMFATNLVPGSTYVFTQCGSAALKIFTGQMPPNINPSDGCNSRRNDVVFSDSAGVASGTLQLNSVMTTAVGSDDCRTDQCFVALFTLAGAGGPFLQNLTFAPGAAATPEPPNPVDASGSPTTQSGFGTASAHASFSTRLSAGVAGALDTPGSVTGPYSAPLSSQPAPATPQSGEGLLRIALSGEHTSWGSSTDTSVVVDVTVDGGTPQQFVLFNGAAPFVYAGFVGPMTTGAHNVSVSVDPALSVGTSPPVAQVLDASLSVVAPSNPSYLAYAYAPVMYGRSQSAAHDTPLLAYAGSTAQANGATRLNYTVIWSHENAGTGFIPWLEWGSWGRMTDIENSMSFTVQADGSVTDAVYLWGGQPPSYPDTQGAISETDVAFTGVYDGHHPVLRVATGNNDFSDQGTTPFRFQQAPVAPPQAGDTREGAMDANPWTYRIMGEEIARWYTDIDTNPASTRPGDARQYAVVQYATSGTGITSVGFDLQVAGDPTWYENDYGSGYPFAGAGTGRTVVKLPVGWQSEAITGLRLRVFPESAAPALQVGNIKVLSLSDNWDLATVPLPQPSVVGAVKTVPPALSLSSVGPTSQHAAAGAALAPLTATVNDALGEPIEGAPVTFSAPTNGPTVEFSSCSCAAVTVKSDAHGVASSGPLVAGRVAGAASVQASTVDPLGTAVAFDITTTTSAPPTVAPTTAPTSVAPPSGAGSGSGSGNAGGSSPADHPLAVPVPTSGTATPVSAEPTFTG